MKKKKRWEENKKEDREKKKMKKREEKKKSLCVCVIKCRQTTQATDRGRFDSTSSW